MSDVIFINRLVENIILKAVSDYRQALRGKGYRGKNPRKVVRECERFFRSDWYETLMPKLDGELLITKLRKEYEDERRADTKHTRTYTRNL